MQVIIEWHDLEANPEAWDYILDSLKVPQDERGGTTLILEVTSWELE